MTERSSGPLSVELICVAPDLVQRTWPYVEHLIKGAVEKCGDWTLEDVKRGLDSRTCLLWVTFDGREIPAAAVTMLQQVPRGLICLAVACGGQDDDWPERFRPIEDYARNEGCFATRIRGRPGWSRLFKDYKMEWVSLEKRLI